MIIENTNPFTSPSFSLGNRLRRQAWSVIWLIFFLPSPRPFHWWRRWLLRRFGARLGRYFHVHSSVRIWAPWNLVAGDYVGIGERAILYNMGKIVIGDYCVISQGAHLCGGSHDYNSPNFQLISKPIELGRHVWICAEAFVAPGVTVLDGVVVGARSVLTKSSVESWVVVAGNPAKRVGNRNPIDRVK